MLHNRGAAAFCYVIWRRMCWICHHPRKNNASWEQCCGSALVVQEKIVPENSASAAHGATDTIGTYLIHTSCTAAQSRPKWRAPAIPTTHGLLDNYEQRLDALFQDFWQRMWHRGAPVEGMTDKKQHSPSDGMKHKTGEPRGTRSAPKPQKPGRKRDSLRATDYSKSSTAHYCPLRTRDRRTREPGGLRPKGTAKAIKPPHETYSKAAGDSGHLITRSTRL
ncbi:Hypothetical predicted protein [Pelobates cultripes]|uniref:Uncharacterized protein n=1 Tax=Pelobates cultripes TaxID=61616 RepID=A0AAD1RKU5_PELCU|nr:Hypothetical predicted protein [Pelobates cultripes]